MAGGAVDAAVGRLIEHVEEVRGVAMRWIERPGSGPAVVLLHGIPTSPELWREVMTRVGDARLLAWELVGYGRSWRAGADRDISVAAQVDHLVAWLDHLGIRSAVLVGHDLGAGVAQIAAVRHTDRVAGIALTDGIAYDNWPVAPFIAVRAIGNLFARLPRPAFALFYWGVINAGHDDLARGRRSAGVHWRAGYDHDDGPAVFLRQVRSLRAQDTLAIADELPRAAGRPVELSWAEKDRFLRLESGRRLARDLGARLDVIPGAGHFTPEDHPDRVGAAIERVLERLGD